jgi:hypothetical protein
MYAVTTIEEVIAQLDKIIEWSLTNKSRIGYFATLYRRMTIAVQQGILNNSFQDGKRMEQLDIIFASRYFTAWNAYINKQPCSNAWCTAFDACQNPDLIVLQQLILGINTHINLDLCIAAAECCPGNKIYDLQSDFEKINQIIEAQSQLMQNTLCNICFPLKLLTNISNNKEKAVLNFSIDTARKCSWANAIVLAGASDSIKSGHISQIDNMVVELAKKIINPGAWINFILKPVKWTESKDVGQLIGVLKN